MKFPRFGAKKGKYKITQVLAAWLHVYRLHMLSAADVEKTLGIRASRFESILTGKEDVTLGEFAVIASKLELLPAALFTEPTPSHIDYATFMEYMRVLQKEEADRSTTTAPAVKKTEAK